MFSYRASNFLYQPQQIYWSKAILSFTIKQGAILTCLLSQVTGTVNLIWKRSSTLLFGLTQFCGHYVSNRQKPNMNSEDQVDRKRPRIEYEREAAAAAAARRAEVDDPYTNHPTLYMDDGNIIMKCTSSTTLFRVHRSILSKHSTILDALFKTAASQQPPKKLRECLFVEVEDDKDDLAGLLVAIYDGL